jgi:uncharacterized membrane protein YphA (DoxX/SURF4 family)
LRFAFRFSVVYLALYALATQVVGGVFLFPGFQLPQFGTVWPMREITVWVAQNIFGVTAPLVFTGGNSADTLFHWVQTFWLLVAAAIVTGVWFLLETKRSDDQALAAWFRLFLRFALAAQMFYYGMAKVIPTQFQRPSLVTLIQPVGHLSLTDLLWTFIGASTPYQVITGIAELLAGILLVVPKTTPLGAVIALADMLQVFILNMTYDFGLKGISFHLILMSLFLLAPDARRLASVLVLDRPAPASAHRPLFRTARANRNALIAQVVFGLYLLVMFTNLSLRFWYTQGDGRPRSPLYGIWDVERLSIDGQVRPPEQNDYDRRWRRVIFDATDVVAFQRTDDSIAHYGVAEGSTAERIRLRKGTSQRWSSTFTAQRPTREQLILEGEMDGYAIRLQLRLVELDTFPLLHSGFRWIRPND